MWTRTEFQSSFGATTTEAKTMAIALSSALSVHLVQKAERWRVKQWDSVSVRFWPEIHTLEKVLHILINTAPAELVIRIVHSNTRLIFLVASRRRPIGQRKSWFTPDYYNNNKKHAFKAPYTSRSLSARNKSGREGALNFFGWVCAARVSKSRV